MPFILQTLTCASSRVRQTFAGAVTPSEDMVNTPAGTHDADDATHDQASDAGDGDMLTPLIRYGVDYVLEPATTSGTIDFVRQRLRQHKGTGTGPGTFSIRPLIGGVPRGAPDTGQSDAFVERAWDFATDPTDGAPWTNARINAMRWGFDGSAASPVVSVSAYIGVSEIIVEAWTLAETAGGLAIAGEIEAGSVAAGVGVHEAGETESGAVLASVGVNAAGEIWVEE